MLRKLLTYTLAVTTTVWSVGLLATPLAVGAAQSGDLVKKAGSPAVYYLGGDNKLHAFPRADIFGTWYSDFSSVITISDTEFNGYGLPSSNVNPKPGMALIQIVDSETPWNIFSPDVYAISGDGVARKLASGSVAADIFGAGWESMIIPVTVTLFGGSYTSGADINSAGDFNKQAEMDAATSINDTKNLGGSVTPGTPVSTGTTLTVSLAADTPASGLILGGTINNKFTKVNLTASADGDIVVDQLKVRRGGTVAADSAFSSIALIDAGTDTRIGNTKTINSEHMATFNKDILVPAGTTVSVYLAGNMTSNSASASGLAGNAGEIPTLDLYSIDASGASVVGSLPIAGNYQNLNGTIIPGILTLADGSNNPDASTQKIGSTNYTLSAYKLTANSTEDFTVNSVTFDQGGTASDSDVANLDLLIDDVLVGTVAKPTDGKVKFTLSPALTIEKGKNVQVDLRGDLVDGSARTVRFDIEDESDVRATGALYGAEVKVAAGTGATADAEPFWTAKVTTIDQGALRIGSATFSSANIPEDNDGIVLGKFEFEAKGETVEITSLPINFTVTTSTGTGHEIKNVKLIDSNGKTVAGPIDASSSSSVDSTGNFSATSTDTISVPAGTSVYTVVADLDDDWTTNDTIIVRINPGQLSAKGETTGLSVTPTPSTDQTSATMTIKTAALSVSVGNTPIAQDVVAGTKGHTFANVVLGAEASGEDIKVTSIKVLVDCTSCKPNETSNWSIFDGSTELSTTNDPDSIVDSNSTDGSEATSTFTLTTPLVIAKGTSKTLTVKGDISTATTGGTDIIQVGITDTTAGGTITAKGNDSGNDATVTVSVNGGQNQSVQSTGLLTISRDSSSPKAGLMPASTSGVTAGIFNVTAQYEEVNLEKLYLTGVAANIGGWDQVERVYIYDGSTLLADVAPTSTDGVDKTLIVDMTNNPIVVPQDTAKKLTIKVDTAGSNYEVGSTGASGQGLWIKIAAAGDVTAKGKQSGNSVTAPDITNASTTAQYLFRSVPTVTPNDDHGSGISGGTLSTKTNEPLYKFAVSASSAGPVALYQAGFIITTSTATTTNLVLTDGTENVGKSNGADKQITITNGSGAVLEFFIKLTSDGAVPTGTNDNLEPYVISAGSTTSFTLRGDLECNALNCSAASSATGGSVSVQLLGDTAIPGTNPDAASDLDDDLDANSFIWGDLWRTPILEISSTTATVTEQWSNGYLVAEADGGKLAATSTSVTFSK